MNLQSSAIPVEQKTYVRQYYNVLSEPKEISCFKCSGNCPLYEAVYIMNSITLASEITMRWC